jgi:DNA-binding response OmpR family regulator
MGHEEAGGTRIRPAASVLIVDDNRDQADSLAALCRVLGHEVQVAYDGESALQSARRSHPGIVFLVITLPGMDGYDVASRLRAELGSTVRLVAVSGRGRDEDRERALGAGFDHFLLKPLDPAFLESLLG